MKNYNKILEAINKGIKFALDDFDDNELIGQLTLTIKDQNRTKEYLDLMNEVVDLDLPSGTLWCKYNLDVDPNLLSTSEDWYGKYYAWGELEPNKTNYGWKTYKFSKWGVGNDLTKYITNSRFGAYDKRVGYIEDNLTELRLEDDATYQFKKCHNFKFHIPTKEQCKELINYTNNYWVNNYDPNKTIHDPKDDGGIQGLNGRVFVGKNAKLLFIPASGCYVNSDISSVGSCCYLWSSSLNLDNPDSACYLSFDSDNIIVHYYNRYIGFTIRPVINL